VTSEAIQSTREALAALRRTPALMQGFGVERVTRRAELWHERLTVAGSGRAILSTVRSFGDASGEDIGRFATELAPATLDDLIQAVDDTVMGGPMPLLSPADVRLEVSIVACGSRLDHVIGGGPPDLEPYQPLLLALDRIAVATRARPQATLHLGIGIPPVIGVGRQTIPLELRFENRGDTGTWIRNPFAPMDANSEHLRLWFAEQVVEQPGVTPLPMEPCWVNVEPAVRVQRPLLWLGPGEREARLFSATLDIDPGTYLMRASFESYLGGETVAGIGMVRGCVFSRECSVEARP
jgi:hypothetical protein